MPANRRPMIAASSTCSSATYRYRDSDTQGRTLDALVHPHRVAALGGQLVGGVKNGCSGLTA
jgi:hypothetical protein